ncbi:toll/interleukin-1 receptor domain-containing protein [Cupriavidus plantarum]|uniref:toll/interleukin-1 receptor domain-containing protein n=1 Tax=Cupriavidus plantarum TaxID=942865 RepID=UPI0015E8186A|nr:toll/interleukin-1 receptor domain-containing protein [Cupriavidus plantarum]
MSIANSHYNLLVSWSPDAWESGTWTLSKDRLFEYTNDIVRGRFEPLSPDAFERLQSLPALFAYEQTCNKPARVGRITGIAHRYDGYGLSFELDSGVAPILPAHLESLQQALDIDPRYELHRTHWAVKEVALASVMQNAGLVNPQATLLTPTPPQVFLSYSHDSVEHKAWVQQLALNLRNLGVDVVLDQWHTGPGDDLAAFMQRSVTNSDFVVMVCTESYVSKIVNNTGGVGFEHNLVTGQLLRELDTSKFIPVIRQSAWPRQVIPSLATRYYVDLSDGQPFREGVEALARKLHKMAPVLPPLGPRPTWPGFGV